MANNFFKKIKEKLAAKPSEDFDTQFWKKFDNEFNLSEIPEAKVIPLFAGLKNIMSLGMAMILIIAIGVTVKMRLEGDPSEMLTEASVLEYEEVLDHLEEFAEFEDINLSEEDWDLLLADT